LEDCNKTKEKEENCPQTNIEGSLLNYNLTIQIKKAL
jgi:hypothetical protein